MTTSLVAHVTASREGIAEILKTKIALRKAHSFLLGKNQSEGARSLTEQCTPGHGQCNGKYGNWANCGPDANVPKVGCPYGGAQGQGADCCKDCACPDPT